MVLRLCGCRNDIISSRFDPCSLLPRPFVWALFFLLAKDGSIIQPNNGASLCQLAPIRRTYRLCQNRRCPNCSSAALTRVGGVLYKRPEYVATRHSTGSCITRPAGVGRKVFVIHRLMATWILLWRKPVFGLTGVPFKSERRTKRSHTSPQRRNDDLEQQGQTTRAIETRERPPVPAPALSRKQHGACNTADKGLLYSGEIDLTSAWNNKSRNKYSL